MQIEAWAANRLAGETAAILSGGYVEVFDAGGNRLLRAPFAQFRKPEAGLVAAYPFPPAIAEADGTPLRFEAFDAEGARVLAGSAGHHAADPKPEMSFKVAQIIKDADVMIESFIVSIVTPQP